MASTVIIKDPRTGYEYAYESVSYRDPITKKPKSKRTYLGRVDPVTREILPKFHNGKRNRTRFNNEEDVNKNNESKNEKLNIEFLKTEIDTLYAKISSKDAVVSKIQNLITEYNDIK